MTAIKRIKDNTNFISKTKNNNELYSIKQSSTKESIIEHITNNFILKNNLQKLPIDVVDVARNNGWVLIPFTKAPQFIYNKFSELIYTDWGFTIRQGNQYFIFYEDRIRIEIQRFTIAHEMGHIVLNHFNGQNFCVKEKDANMFASCLLMPRSILKKCDMDSACGISAMCGVSYRAASNKLSKIYSNSDKEFNELEKSILKQFNNYITNYFK